MLVAILLSSCAVCSLAARRRTKTYSARRVFRAEEHDIMQTIKASAFLDGVSDRVAYTLRVKHLMCHIYAELSGKREASCTEHLDGFQFDASLEPYGREEDLSTADKMRANVFINIGKVVKAAKGYFPRKNQMFAALLLTDDDPSGVATARAAAQARQARMAFGQVNTGQGKTLIAAMIALYMHATTEAAHRRMAIAVLTTNEVLTRQSFAETREVFRQAENIMKLKLGVTIFGPESDESVAKASIVYIDPFQLSRDYANFYKKRMNDQQPLLPWHQSSNIDDPNFKSMVLVDEVDAVLYDGVGESFLSTKPLPFAEKLGMIAQRIAIECSAQKSGTSVCEDQGLLESLRESILKDVTERPNLPNPELVQVSNAMLDETVDQLLAALGNSRMYSKSDSILKSQNTLPKLYNWIVKKLDDRYGEGQGEPRAERMIESGELSLLKPVLAAMKTKYGCVTKKGDFGTCAEFKEYVKAQISRWLREARNLFGDRPQLVRDRNYIVRGKGLCTYLAGDQMKSLLAPPRDNGQCRDLDEGLLCDANQSTRSATYDRGKVVKTLACVEQWRNKLKPYRNKDLSRDPSFSDDYQDLMSRFSVLKEMLTTKAQGGGAPDAGRAFLDDLRKDVSFSKVIYVDKVSGLIRERMRFNGFKHLFLEHKHNGLILTSPSSETVALSRIRSLAGFDVVMGFTGTLPKKGSSGRSPGEVVIEKAADDILSYLQGREFTLFSGLFTHLYGDGQERPRFVYVAPFAPSRLVLKPPIHRSDAAKKWQSLAGEIAAVKDQCGLVVVEDIATLYQVRKWFPSVKIFIGDKSDEDVPSATYNAGDIVATTAVGSRGVDWHCTAPGGFEVMATFLSQSLRVQRQIMGRAARSGEHGSYIEIVERAEVDESSKKQGKLQTNLVRQVFASLKSDLQTDALTLMGDWNVAQSEVNGSKAEMRLRQDKFRLWLTDSHHRELGSSLQRLTYAEYFKSTGMLDNATKGLTPREELASAEHQLEQLLKDFQLAMKLEDVSSTNSPANTKVTTGRARAATPSDGVYMSVAGIKKAVIKAIEKKGGAFAYLHAEIGNNRLAEHLFQDPGDEDPILQGEGGDDRGGARQGATSNI